MNRLLAYTRLRNQLIAGRSGNTPAETVQRLGAVQAQDYSQALWAIGLRTRNSLAADVERAINDRQIVISWAMRGTLHAVPAEDLSWMIRLLAPRVLAKDKRRMEQLELDFKQISKCESIIHAALQDRKQMPRSDLMALLESAGISTKNQRGYHILWRLAQTGLICPGPMDGKQQTFVLLEEWIPVHNRFSAEESLKELTKRYFTGHGPATLHDFSWWSGLTVKEARNGIEAAQGVLHCEKIDGVEYWMGGDGTTESDEQSGIFLLAGFDEYILGYKDRDAVLQPEYFPRIVPGNNGVFAPLLVVDGEVKGIWRRTIKKDGVEIEVRPFAGTVSGIERIAESARRYGEFVGMPLLKTTILEK